MHRLMISLLLAALPGLAAAQWQLLPETTLIELYSVKETPFYQDSSIPGVSALSWPNGDQAIVTYVEVVREGEKQLHRCIDFYTSEMESTGSSCYVLVRD